MGATVGWATYFVGCEFYAFSTRDLIAKPSNERQTKIRDQFVLHLIVYAVTLPAIAAASAAGVLPWPLAAWAVLLLVLEHVGLELNRILIAIGAPLSASVAMFLRGGAWCFAVMALMAYDPALRTLDVAFAAWAIGAAASCALGFIRIKALEPAKATGPVDWAWIRRGLYIAAPLMLASLSTRGIFMLDRYWVEALSGLATLGAYVLFVSMASAVITFIDAGVIDFAYPRLVAAARAGQEATYRQLMRELATKIVCATALLVIGVFLVGALGVTWLGKPHYIEQAYLLPWLLLAAAIQALGMIPHVGLYARGNDRPIVWSQLAGLGAFIAILLMFGGRFGVVIVPWAMCVGFTVILVWKSLAFRDSERTIAGGSL
jgi:O-antigen/teichoic acid export membrane protein